MALPAQSGIAQTVVTSPPYWGLRAYADADADALGAESTVERYIDRLMLAMDECWRVLRDDGTLWLVLGDTYHAKAGAGDGTRKQGRKQVDGQRVDRQNRARAGTPKSLALVPQRAAIALADRGWAVRQEIIWEKPDAMPSSVKDRPSRSHETIIFAAKSKRYRFNPEAIREDAVSGVPSSGNVERRAAEGSVKGLAGSVPWQNDGWRTGRSIWRFGVERIKGHSAIFPKALARKCIEASTDLGDLVVDPFCGTGTTVLVAESIGRRGLGFDISPTYLGIATGRGINRSLL